MNYIELVKNSPNKDERIMWESIESVSRLVEKIRSKHPDVAHKWLMGEYCRMYGPHFNEELAREEVSSMYHISREGERVDGEIIGVDDAVSIIPDGRTEGLRWDAYVAANGFAHDMARSRISTDAIMDAARVFWFEDDDFKDSFSKVFWYYSSK